MRKIVTAVSAAALGLSMLASAVPALAVSGYDSAYAGESAFVFISPGQTQNFQVFFANTGTTTWSRGTGTQVDLAACLSDKVTCNAVDPANASWNSGWLSTTRYATTTQTTTAPGSLGTFSYNVTAPVGAAAGNYRFQGDLVLSTTGEKIHPEGYYQDATIGTGAGGAATLTSLTPTSGTTTGGTTVTITGSGIVCTPAFPAVSFGGTNAAVSSCGSTSIVATSPAHAAGGVSVTVTNSGSAASNGLSFFYIDLTPPQFTGQSTASNVVTVNYSKPVCRTTAFVSAGNVDWQVRNVSAAGLLTVAADTTPVCNSATAPTNGVTSAKLILSGVGSTVPPGAFIEVTLLDNAVGSGRNVNFRDQSTANAGAGNTILAPQAQTATATNPPTGAPTIASASGTVGTNTVKVTFSEGIFCTGMLTAPPSEWTLNSGNPAVTDPTFTAVVARTAAPGCGTAQTDLTGSFSLTTGTSLPANTTYTLTFAPAAGCPAVGCGKNEIRNVYNVSLVDNPGTASVTFTTGAPDITPPIIIDADISAKSTGGSDFGFAGDAFVLTFSKKMDGGPSGGPGCSTGAPSCSISIQDQDGTVGLIPCGTGKATCTWDTGVINLTVKITTNLIGPNTTGTAGCVSSSSGCDIWGGTTPGMAIPFNITAISGVWDASSNKNPVNVLGSTDRLVEYPSEVGG